MKKISIKTLSKDEIDEIIKSKGFPSYRTNQIWEWLYGKHVSEFFEMTNLPKNLIDYLSSNFVIEYISELEKQESRDGSIKYLFEGYNNSDDQYTKSKLTKSNYLANQFEAVFIPSNHFNRTKYTICISSQIGCAMHCNFCATAKQGFTRNLQIGEIIDQIYLIEKSNNCKITNIVFMGQGEPFLNYNNLIEALSIINCEKFNNIASRKITISTCGIIPEINKFSGLNKQYRLAISLHSCRQKIRDKIMPGVKKYNLEALKNSLHEYNKKTNRRITLEYLLLKNINDGIEDLQSLITFVKGLNCHVNLLHYNSVSSTSYSASEEDIFQYWILQLKKNNINVTIRESRGNDIDAACGQLINK